MDGVNPVETFPEAGIRKALETPKRVLRLPATEGSSALSRAFRSNCRSDGNFRKNKAIPELYKPPNLS